MSSHKAALLSFTRTGGEEDTILHTTTRLLLLTLVIQIACMVCLSATELRQESIRPHHHLQSKSDWLMMKKEKVNF